MKFCSKKLAGAIFLSVVSFCLFSCQKEINRANVSPQENSPAEQFAPIRISDLNANAAEPAITANGRGGVYIVYVEHNTDRSADIYLQKYHANKGIVGEKTRVNPEKGQAKAWFGDAPTVKTGSDGTVYVGWTAKAENSQSTNASVLYLSVSRDDGNSFGAPVKVNDDVAPAAHGMHSLAIGSDNRVYMAWLDERNLKIDSHAARFVDKDSTVHEPEFKFFKAHHNSNQSARAKAEKPVIKEDSAEPNSETFFAASADGGKTFAPNVKLSSDVCPCCKTNLLAAPDGKIYVSWRQVLPENFRHIAVASSADNGNNFSAPVIVSDDQWQISACPVSGAPLMINANSLMTAWFTAGSAGKPGIYLAESKDGGATFMPRALVSENAASGTPILLADKEENARIVWAEAGKILTAKLRDGALAGVNRQEIGQGEFPAATFSDGQIYTVFVRKDKDGQSILLSLS